MARITRMHAPATQNAAPPTGTLADALLLPPLRRLWKSWDARAQAVEDEPTRVALRACMGELEGVIDGQAEREAAFAATRREIGDVVRAELVAFHSRDRQ